MDIENYFDNVPDELVIEIMCLLLDDSRAFINFTSTCLRFCYLSRRITSLSIWEKKKPIIYKAYAYKRKSLNKRKEKSTVECPKCTYCHDKLGAKRYHGLYCLANLKYRRFSSIKFEDRLLLRSHSIDNNRILDQDAIANLTAVVELIVTHSTITLEWLDRVVKELPKIKYITLERVEAHYKRLVDSFNPKTLTSLRILHSDLSDDSFMYFVENFPAMELHLMGTTVEFNEIAIRRYYHNWDSFDLRVAQPSRDIFSFHSLLVYLKKHKKDIRRLAVGNTRILYHSLKRILDDDELEHIRIYVLNPFLLTANEQARLINDYPQKINIRP